MSYPIRGIIESAKTPVTSVETKYLPEFEFPRIFGCISKGTVEKQKKQNVDITFPIIGNCSAGQASVWSDSEQLYDAWKKPVCIPIHFDDSTNAEAAALVTKLKQKYSTTASGNVGACYVTNFNGEFRPKRGEDVELMVQFELSKPITGGVPHAVGGLWPQGESPFDEQGILTAMTYRAPMVNVWTEVAVSMDKVIDSQGFTFLESSGKDKSKTSYEYKVSRGGGPYDVIAVAYPGNPASSLAVAGTYLVNGQVPDPSGRPTAIVGYQVESFLSREVVIKHKSFTEIWAALGGAMAGALLSYG